MQLDNSYLLSGTVMPLNGNSIENTPIKKASEAEQAANAFSSLFIEKMLNEIQGDKSPFTGEKRSAGEVMANQLMNRQLAQIIAEKSELSSSLAEYIERTQQ